MLSFAFSVAANLLWMPINHRDCACTRLNSPQVQEEVAGCNRAFEAKLKQEVCIIIECSRIENAQLQLHRSRDTPHVLPS
jgi:hypothetical protein